jgi:predicted RND superfamily exporter protein
MAEPRTEVARGLQLLIIAGVVLLGGWSLATLRFQTELLPLFPQNLASVETLKKAQGSMMSERQILAVAKPGTNPGWQALAQLAEKVRGQPGIGGAEVGLGAKGSPAEWLAGMIAALPASRFAAVQKAVTPEAIDNRLRETLGAMSGAMDENEMARLRFDPLRLNEIIFPPPGPNPLAGSLALPPVLTIDPDHALKTFEDDQHFVAQVRAALESQSVSLSPRPEFLLTGQPAITADISRHMRRDIFVMIAFTLALTSLAFWLTYRSLMPLVWIIVAQILAVLCAAVAARLVFTQVNVLSIGFSSILLGVGMDYCILVYHFFAQPGELDQHAWHELRRAIWLSSVTTAATFGILFFSSFPGLRQLAVLVGVGLVATAFFATTFLARLLARRRPHAPRWLVPLSDRCARFMSRHRLAFRVAACAVVVGVVLLAPQLVRFPFYDPSVEQLEPSDLEPYQAQKLLQDQAPKMPSEDFTAADAQANRLNWQPLDPANLRARFQQAGFDPTWAAPTVQVVEILNRWHAGTIDLTGPAQASAAWVQLRDDLNRTAVRDFKRLSFFMLAIVLTLCFVAHRSARLVVLNFTALLLALMILAMLLYASDTSMTLLSLLCIPLMIGLVIDYSLHILLALEHAGGDLVDAARHLAVPVLLTGIASLIGFTAPMLSSQPALQNFGNVMDLGTIAAVTSGLILLPALYGRLKHVHRADEARH